MNKPTLKLVSLLLIIAAGIVSCDKGTEEPDVEEIYFVPTCKITSFETKYSYDNVVVSTDVASLTYNSDGTLKQMNSTSTGDYSYSYIYNFTYKNGRLSELTSSYLEDGETYSGTAHFTWDGVKLMSYYYEELVDGVMERDEYRYEYTDNQVTRLSNWDNYSFEEGVLTEYGYDEFDWSEGNVIEARGFSNDDMGGRFELKGNKKRSRLLMNGRSEGFSLSYTTTLTHDNKNNPQAFIAYVLGGVVGMGRNNALTTLLSDTDGWAYGSTISYEYNEQGYPIKMEQVDPDGYFKITGTYNYDCN